MSEGTQSAQRINDSLTGDPYLLHRVDASQLQAPVRVVNGNTEEPYDEDDDRTPLTRMEVAGLVLMVASSAAVSLAVLRLIWSLL